MRWIGTLVALAAVALVSVAQAGMSVQELAWIEKNKDQLRAQLKDGDAAKFRNVTVSYKMNGRTPIVCGEVNAKNGLGAYGGFKGWIGAGSTGQYLAEQMKAGEFGKLWREICG